MPSDCRKPKSRSFAARSSRSARAELLRYAPSQRSNDRSDGRRPPLLDRQVRHRRHAHPVLGAHAALHGVCPGPAPGCDGEPAGRVRLPLPRGSAGDAAAQGLLGAVPPGTAQEGRAAAAVRGSPRAARNHSARHRAAEVRRGRLVSKIASGGFPEMLKFLAAALLSWSLACSAQDYPAKPILFLMPLQAGSAVDVMVRIVAEKMSGGLGRQVLVENQPGAAGMIGAERIKRAAPDGYTIGVLNDSILTMIPNVRPVPYDPLKDFAPIGVVAGI